MHPGFVVEIPFDAEPVDSITVSDADGSQEEVPIHGFIAPSKESLQPSAVSPNHEKDAENLAIALDVHGKFGLASPNETRRFNSPANQSALVLVQDLERRYRQEGLTAYLVDEQINNKRQALLGRK